MEKNVAVNKIFSFTKKMSLFFVETPVRLCSRFESGRNYLRDSVSLFAATAIKDQEVPMMANTCDTNPIIYQVFIGMCRILKKRRVL